MWSEKNIDNKEANIVIFEYREDKTTKNILEKFKIKTLDVHVYIFDLRYYISKL